MWVHTVQRKIERNAGRIYRSKSQPILYEKCGLKAIYTEKVGGDMVIHPLRFGHTCHTPILVSVMKLKAFGKIVTNNPLTDESEVEAELKLS